MYTQTTFGPGSAVHGPIVNVRSEYPTCGGTHCECLQSGTDWVCF